MGWGWVKVGFRSGQLSLIVSALSGLSLSNITCPLSHKWYHDNLKALQSLRAEATLNSVNFYGHSHWFLNHFPNAIIIRGQGFMELEQRMNTCIVKTEVYLTSNFSWCWPLTCTFWHNPPQIIFKQAGWLCFTVMLKIAQFACCPSIIIKAPLFTLKSTSWYKW